MSEVEVQFSTNNGQFEFRQWLDEDGIVNAKSSGMQDVDASNRIIAAYQAAYESLGYKYLHVLDVSELKDVPPEAAKLMKGFCLAESSPMSRMAVFGSGFFMRTFFNMYAKISSIPMRVFKTQEEAVTWVKGDQK